MFVSRRTLITLLATILLMLVIQLIRLSVGLTAYDASSNLYRYNPNEALTLTDTDKGSCRKLKALILHDYSSAESLASIKTMLRGMQIVTEDALFEAAGDNLKGYDLVVIMGPVSSGEKAGMLSHYANDGGHLLYLGSAGSGQPDLLAKASDLFGIAGIEAVQPIAKLVFHTELLSGITGSLSISQESGKPASLGNACGLQLTPDCTVHLAGDPGLPLIWQRSAGGQVMVVNMDAYARKSLRGILSGAVSSLLGTAAYPVTASAVWQITNIPVDDQLETDRLSTNYSRSFSRYILDIWWNDMAGLMKKSRIVPTVAYLGSFNGLATGPFSAPRLTATNARTLFQSLARIQGEVSFQGYNLLPLCGSGSQSAGMWPDEAAMEQAILCSLDFLAKLLPRYPMQVYTPPQFCFDMQNLPMIKQAMPELRTICGLYDTAAVSGLAASDLLIQDFALDDRYGVSFPVITHGCVQDDALRFAMASGVTTNGVIHHMIEADAVLDEIRSRGLLWEEMADEYARLFRYTDEVYGWLTPRTVSAASEKLRQSLELDVYFSVDDQGISIACDRFTSDASIMLVSGAELSAVSGCTCQRIDSLRYLVIMQSPVARLEVKR